MDDLYPTEFEVLIGSLMVLMREEKDVEAKISSNSEDIKKRVQDVVVSSAKEEEAKIEPINVDISYSASPETPSNQSETEPADYIIDDISDNASPLAKKLFKQVALHTHPDKVKDDRLNRFFLVGRKALEQNDVITLLFILSKCSPKNVLADGEIEELKSVLEKRHTSVAAKKDTVTYKWNTYTEEVKQVLIKHLV